MFGLNPDMLVVQEMTSSAAMSEFYTNVMNVVAPGLFTYVPFHDGRDTDNGLYFRTDKWVFLDTVYIGTALRDIAEYVVRPINSSEQLHVFSMHLKASSGSTNEQSRLAEVTILRNYLNNLPPGTNFVIVGDYNIYSSIEPAWQKLLGSEANNIGQCTDPLALTGTWNSAGLAQYHTQSPRVRSFGGGVTGGLDDRFDIILTSSSMSTRIAAGSYKAYGNDGNHYNDSINRLPNAAVPDSIAKALHNASDHIPVTAKFIFQTSIRAGVVALLEGPYNSGTMLMERTLNTGGILGAHFSGSAIPSQAVDSITVELRNTAVNPTIRKYRPAWLLSDGTIRGFSDTTKSYVEFDMITGSYYLVVHHRNHLSIMTSGSVALTNATASPYNFTTSQSAYGANAMKQIGQKFVMYAGDANQSRSILTSDANAVFDGISSSGYILSDCNLSGIVSASDAGIVFGNLNRSSQVP